MIPDNYGAHHKSGPCPRGRGGEGWASVLHVEVRPEVWAQDTLLNLPPGRRRPHISVPAAWKHGQVFARTPRFKKHVQSPLIGRNFCAGWRPPTKSSQTGTTVPTLAALCCAHNLHVLVAVATRLRFKIKPVFCCLKLLFFGQGASHPSF